MSCRVSWSIETVIITLLVAVSVIGPLSCRWYHVKKHRKKSCRSMGYPRTRAVRKECMGQKTRRLRAFPSHTLPRSPTIFLTAPLSYDAVAIHLGQCEKLRRYRKLATSSHSGTDTQHGWHSWTTLCSPKDALLAHSRNPHSHVGNDHDT